MGYGWNRQFEEFHDQVRKFALESLTPQLQAELDSADEGRPPQGPATRAIRKAIGDRGWMRMCWPVEYGGEGKSLWYQYLLIEELSYWGIPYSLGTAAMIGPRMVSGGMSAFLNTWMKMTRLPERPFARAVRT